STGLTEGILFASWMPASRRERTLGSKIRHCVLVFTTFLLVAGSECQTLAPVDISGFGKDRPVQAFLAQVSSSECKGSSHFKYGASHYDDLSYDVHVSATVIFKNRSTRPVLLYKGFKQAGQIDEA